MLNQVAHDRARLGQDDRFGGRRGRLDGYCGRFAKGVNPLQFCRRSTCRVALEGLDGVFEMQLLHYPCDALGAGALEPVIMLVVEVLRGGKRCTS